MVGIVSVTDFKPSTETLNDQKYRKIIIGNNDGKSHGLFEKNRPKSSFFFFFLMRPA